METVTSSHIGQRDTSGVTENFCVSSAKQSGALVLWDQEEANSSDKKDALWVTVEYRGMHTDLSLSRLSENWFFVSYTLFNWHLYMHTDQHLSEHKKGTQSVNLVPCQS